MIDAQRCRKDFFFFYKKKLFPFKQRNETARVKRYETKGDVIVLYFDEIANETCISVVVHPAFQVSDAKEANIKIYDYYQPEHSRSVSYNLPSGMLHT